MRIFILCLIIGASFSLIGPGKVTEELVNRYKKEQENKKETPNPDIGQDPIFPVRGKSGYIGVTDAPDKNKMFYWYFESQNDPENAPLLIWLTGGPGCSSELAIAFENGPWFIVKDDSGKNKFVNNPNSWNQKANVLYIDQPIGTGYSFGEKDKYARNQDMVKQYFVQFFEGWLELDDFKRFKGHPLFISGESYAGHYIPQVGNALYFRSLENPDINLKGLAIGNGWMTPKSQEVGATTFIGDNKKAFKINDEQYKKMQKLVGLDMQLWGNWNRMLALNKGALWEIAQPAWVNNKKFNPYDISKECIGALCYDMAHFATFFNREDVKKELGVTKEKWELCSNDVGNAIGSDGNTDSMLNAIPLLEAGIPILFYTGMLDYVCNWRGTEQVLHDVEWSGQSSWNRIKEYTKGPFGEFKQYQNLKFIKIANSGHMVPADQGVIALGMINQFLADNMD